MPVNTATEKGLKTSYTIAGIFSLLFISATVLLTSQYVSAQQAEVTSGTTPINSIPPARNWQYFQVIVQPGSLVGKTRVVNTTFLSKGVVACEVNESASTIRLKCEKGVFLESIKQTLTWLGLTMVSYREEYTNREPVIFQ